MIKRIILYLVSAWAGTFVCDFLEKTPMNVWLARGIGCFVAVVVAMILYKILIRK